MHTRFPCGTSSTVNAPSQHPGRFNPPYTCKHVLRCAYRRVVPASTLPSVARNKFCCGFLPGSSLRLFQGATGDAQRTASTTAEDFPPLSSALLPWWILDSVARPHLSMHIPIVVPSYSESLCFLSCAPILCVLSVCGESFFPRGTCNRLLSGRERRTSPGGCIGSPDPSRPLAWSSNIAYCPWLSAGLPTIIISSRSNSSHACASISFILLAGVSVV